MHQSHARSCRLVLCSASAIFRRVFGVETKLKVPSLTDCPGWSKRRLQKVSPTSINAGAVDGFLSVLSKWVCRLILATSLRWVARTLDYSLLPRCLENVSKTHTLPFSPSRSILKTIKTWKCWRPWNKAKEVRLTFASQVSLPFLQYTCLWMRLFMIW